MKNVVDFKLNKDGNVSSVQCAKCKIRYNNPLLENNFRKFDDNCEIRMSKNRIEIRCQKCNVPLIIVT